MPTGRATTQPLKTPVTDSQPTGFEKLTTTSGRHEVSATQILHANLMVKLKTGSKVSDVESFINKLLTPLELTVRNLAPLFPGEQDRDLKLIYKCEIPATDLQRAIQLLKSSKKIDYAHEPALRKPI